MHFTNQSSMLIMCQLSARARAEVADDPRFEYRAIEAVIREPLPQIRGIIIRSGVAINKELLDLLPGLEVVIRAGNGTDNIEVSELERRNIRLLHNPAISATAVAEIAFASLLTLARRIPEAMALNIQQIWDKERLLGERLADLSVAIWGAGPVGRACGDLFQRACCHVVYAQWPSVPPGLPQCSQEALFAQMDAHILCVPLRPENRELVNERFLQLSAGKSPYIVNVARYEILKVPVVAEALLAGRLRGVAIDPIDRIHFQSALDLFRPQSLPSNLLLLQHLGAQRVDIMDTIGLWALQEAKAWLNASPAG